METKNLKFKFEHFKKWKQFQFWNTEHFGTPCMYAIVVPPCPNASDSTCYFIVQREWTEGRKTFQIDLRWSNNH